jgi:hypothetical protein
MAPLTRLLLRLFQPNATQLAVTVRYVPASGRTPKLNATTGARDFPPKTLAQATKCASSAHSTVEDTLVYSMIFASVIKVQNRICAGLPSVAWLAPYEGKTDL